MLPIMYLQAGRLGEIPVTWFAVVLRLPHMLSPNMTLQGLDPRQDFVTNVASAIIFGDALKNSSSLI